MDNNQYGISINIKDSTSVENIADRGVAYNIPTKLLMVIDFAVYEAKEAVNHAKSGNGPYLIEAKTYRFRGHMEGISAYRTREEESQWMENVPS